MESEENQQTPEEIQKARGAARVKRGDAAETGAYEAGLRREMRETRTSQRAGKLREDRQVGMQPDAIQSSDAQREQRPLVLEATELALDGSARAVELARAVRLARDQRVQAVGLDPSGGGLALAGRAAPRGSTPLVVGSGERPLAVLTRRRAMLATLDSGV